MILTAKKICSIVGLMLPIVASGWGSPEAIANHRRGKPLSSLAPSLERRSPLEIAVFSSRADKTHPAKSIQVAPGQRADIPNRAFRFRFEPSTSFIESDPDGYMPARDQEFVSPTSEMSAIPPLAEPDTRPVSMEANDLRPIQPLSSDQKALPLPTAPPVSVAQADAEASEGDLAAASQNPIADLISVPFQNNTNFGVGPFDRTQNVLNIQPVYPIDLSEDLLLVTRTIVPIVTQPDIDGGNHIWGLGDINPTFLLVPKTEGNLTWGVGPTFGLPTATDPQTGTGKWSVGPAGVFVVNSGPWVYGALASQFWSFAGDSDRPDVNQFVTQPFVNYNLPNGWYLVSSPIITANWNASAEKWTLPIGGGFGRVFNIGRQPVNAQTQFFWNAIAPEGAADFTLRFQLTLLFPQ